MAKNLAHMDSRNREVRYREEELRPLAPESLGALYNLLALGAGQSRGMEAAQHRDLVGDLTN